MKRIRCPNPVLSAARHRGWKTRREKYGPSGTAGPYTRGRIVDWRNYPLARLAAVIHAEGILTESQIGKITGHDILAVRELVDLGREHLAAKPPKGAWATNLMRRILGA